MSASLSALLPPLFLDVGGAYEVTGTTPALVATWKHRFTLSPVNVTTLTGTSQWRLHIDDGALSWPTPTDSTGTTSPLNLGVLDVSGLAQGTTLHARIRLENTPASPTSIGACTITNGSPMLVTRAAHGLNDGDIVRFTTTSALPGPLVVGTSYYVLVVSSSTIHLAATEGGTAINGTGSAGSGTHTVLLYKAVSTWQTIYGGSFATGAALAAIPIFTTTLIRGVQVIPGDLTTMSVAWNGWPGETQADIVGTRVIVFAVGALAGGGGTAVVDGLGNFAQFAISNVSDGEEINVTVYPAIDYPLDALLAFTATGGHTIGTAVPPTDLRATATSLVGTANDATPLTGPATLQLQLGVPAAATWQYVGSSVAQVWAINEAPAGLTISAPSPGQRLGVLGGTPNEEGIYSALVSCQAAHGYVRTVASLPCSIAVTGRLCLGWLHTDPLALDLQFLLATRQVKSYRFPAGVLELVRGDTLAFTVLLRAGPVTPTNYGPLVDPTALRDLRLVIRPANDFDGEPYLVAVAPLALAAVTTFTADASTDTLTAVAAHGLLAGDRVQFSSATTLPAGLAAATDYYVLATGLTTTTCKLAATFNGAAIDITDAGTGVHTLSRYNVAITTIAGHQVVALIVLVSSPVLDDAFAELDKSPGPDTAQLALKGMGELVYTDLAGSENSSRSIECLLTQDVAR